MASPAPSTPVDCQHPAHRVLEVLQDGVILMDDALRVTYMNPASARYAGMEPHDLVGRILWEALPAVRDDEFGQAIQGTLADGVERHVESTTSVVPGKWFEADYVRVRGGIAVIFRDVTARHAAEATLRKEHLELERLVQERTAGLETANRELDAFNYSVSHDLRAHLRGISAFCGLLRARYAQRLPSDGLQILDRVVASCGGLGHVVEGLLRLTQVNRAAVVQEDVDISAMARHHLMRLGNERPRRHVDWTVDDGITVWADKDLMDVVVDNLLANAWKFTARTPEARIRVLRTPTGFSVEDNGAGFDMARAGRLFQPFSRLHTDREFEGHGIGLATVARILDRHGGGISAQSSPGSGTTMTVRIPAPAVAA